MGQSIAFATYLAVSAAIEPMAERVLARRAARGKEDPDRLDERRGIALALRPKGPLVWIHAASVGEALAVQELIRRLTEARTDVQVLVTTGTRTSAEILKTRLPARARHQFVPLDARRFVRRFLRHWHPDLAVWTESELWPRLIHETDRAGIPMLLLNARMSKQSHDAWRWMPTFAASILRRFDLVLAQDTITGRYLRRLGVPRDRLRVIGTLKEGAQVLPYDEAQRARFAKGIGTRPVWLAASTHPGEEEQVVAAHKRLLRGAFRLLLILVPRHPERGDALAAMLRQAGLNVAQRSRGESLDEDVQVYLADTLGEMGLWYRLAPISFVGGSLTDRGGHNPFEPAALGSAILHGPHTGNFDDIYRRLDDAGACMRVTGPDDLVAAVEDLLAPDRAAGLAHAAWDVSSRGAEVTDRTLDAVLAFLPQPGTQ